MNVYQLEMNLYSPNIDCWENNLYGLGIGLFLANNVFECFSSGKKTFKQLEMLLCLFCSVRLEWIKI